jgi:hypothetical protein
MIYASVQQTGKLIIYDICNFLSSIYIKDKSLKLNNMQDYI